MCKIHDTLTKLVCTPYDGSRQISDIHTKLFQPVFHISSEMFCNLLHRLLDTADLLLQPIDIVFIGKREALLFEWTLIFNLKNVGIALRLQ